MPVVAVLGAVLLIVAIAAVRAMTRVVEAHAGLAIWSALTGVPVLAAVAFAVFRGTMHHVIVSVPAKRTRPQLPAPAARQEIETAPSRPADPFSAGPAAWAELVELADREDLYRQGRREARPLLLCEGPDCRNQLDGAPWIVELEDDLGDREEHSFCSGECARAWRRHDQEARELR